MLPRRPCARLASLAQRIRAATPTALQRRHWSGPQPVPAFRATYTEPKFTVTHGKAQRSSSHTPVELPLQSAPPSQLENVASSTVGDAWQDDMNLKGGLVEFKEGKQRRLGILTSKIIHEDKYFLVDETDVCISKNNITFEWSSDDSLFGFPDLYAIRAHTAQQLSGISVEQVKNLWREYSSSKKQSVLTPLAVAEFLKFSAGDSALYTAYCILRDNPLYFKAIGHSLFVCRSAQLIRQSTQVEEQSEEERVFVQALRAQIRKQVPQHALPHQENKSAPSQGVEVVPLNQALLQQVKLYACTQFHNQSFYNRFVSPLGVGHPKQLLELFEKLGHWLPNYDNPVLFRFTDLPTASFAPMIEEQVAKVLKKPPMSSDERWDLRALPVFTIDDPTTTDVDDGLSFARDKDGNEWIYIHVADPTRYIAPNSGLDSLARARSTSIYLPERVIPMLPTALVEAASLEPGKENYALTFGAQLDGRGQISDYKIAPSILANVHKLPYGKVDAILDGAESSEFLEQLRSLQGIATLRRGYREAQGAARNTYQQVQVQVDGRQIKMKHYAEKSRDLVAEYMILGGALAADFAAQKKIPIPFRAQMGPRGIASATNSGPIGDLSAMLGPSLFSAVASPHTSLGLLAYSQATSPIRRYGDLLVHQQLKAALRKEAQPYSTADLVSAMNDVSHTTMRAKRVEKLSQRYWLLRYLEAPVNSGRVYTGMVVDVKGFRVNASSQLALVYLQEFQQAVSVDLQMSKGASRGDKLSLRIATVDALSDLLVMGAQD